MNSRDGFESIFGLLNAAISSNPREPAERDYSVSSFHVVPISVDYFSIIISAWVVSKY